MQGNNSKRSCALSARGCVALWGALVLVTAFSARPAEAAPFAYVTSGSNTVSVIDTATNPPTVVATVPVGFGPFAVAVTPDGKHVYVTNVSDNPVSVIATATNTVTATVPVGAGSGGVAITPDGTHAYVTSFGSNLVSVIDTSTNKVVATVPVGPSFATSNRVAVTPDGKHAYVTVDGTNTVAVIATSTNKVVAMVAVPGGVPSGLAISPDGKHAYFTEQEPPFVVVIIDTRTNKVVNTVNASGFEVAFAPDGKRAYVANNGGVAVIDTASEKVVARVPVPDFAFGLAVTPDGKHVYVTGGGLGGTGNFYVIDTAMNKVAATVAVGGSVDVGIIPDIPFSAFSAKLEIDFHGAPNEDVFELRSNFTLGSTSNGINPVAEPVTLQIGSFATTIPPGSFKGTGFGPFTFLGLIDGAALEVTIKPTGTKRFALEAEALDANLKGTKNPVTVRVSIGNNSATTSVKADLDF